MTTIKTEEIASTNDRSMDGQNLNGHKQKACLNCLNSFLIKNVFGPKSILTLDL